MSEEIKELIDQLEGFGRAWGDLPSIAPHPASAPGFTTGGVILWANKAATALRALTAPVGDEQVANFARNLRSGMAMVMPQPGAADLVEKLARENAVLRAKCSNLTAQLDEQFGTPCAQIAWHYERDALREALGNLIGELDDLIGESHGVYGLHLNGDPSPWSEIVEGGRFERLTSLEAARAALSPPAQASAPGPMQHSDDGPWAAMWNKPTGSRDDG